MNLLKKIVTVAMAILAALIATVFLAVAIWAAFDQNAGNALSSALTNPGLFFAISLLAMLTIGLACVAIVLMWKETIPESILLHAGASGSAFLTIPAMNAMVQRYLRMQGITSKVKKKKKKNGASVTVRVIAQPNETIPSLAEKLQSEIQTYLIAYTGVQVEKVSVVVDTAEKKPAKSRVV